MTNTRSIQLPDTFQYIQTVKRIYASYTDSESHKHELPATVDEISQQLPLSNHIVRVHRSWIINKNYVLSVLPGNAFHVALLRMLDGTIVPVQKSNIKYILDLIRR